MKMHLSEDIKFEQDRHDIIQNADFSALDKLYDGRKIYFGDYHCHSQSGGKSDGHTTPEQWLEAMKDLHLDFVGLMDHKQVRHMFLDCFDEEFFICGTEPGGYFIEPEVSFHYLMIVPKKESLLKVLEAFPEMFNFEGGPEGFFEYIRVEKSKFLEVVKAIQDEGGVVVHAHPKQVMKSDNPDDYYFGEGAVIEIVYTFNTPAVLNQDTIDNYKLWMEFLNRGYKVINTATSDCHGTPSNIAMNAVYSDAKNGPAYVKYLKQGDLNSGFLGIKMSIDSNPVGSTAKYTDDMKLLIKVEDGHIDNYDPNESYCLEVITDKGIAYSNNITLPFNLALEVKDRKFYRVMIIRESDGAPAAIGNPIWLEK